MFFGEAYSWFTQELIAAPLWAQVPIVLALVLPAAIGIAWLLMQLSDRVWFAGWKLLRSLAGSTMGEQVPPNDAAK